MTTKFTWEPSTGGSLLFHIKEGNRETTWTLKKNASVASVRQMLWEMESLIDEYNPRYERIPGVNAEPTSTEWRGIQMVETVRTVADDELRLLESMKSLADKADSVKLEGRDFWGASDMDELDLYTLGTGEPE